MGIEERSTRVEMSRGDIDWIQVRECFVRAFHRYPLYKFLVPSDNKREEFLRRYLEANYDVAVRKGRSILLAINLYTDRSRGAQKENIEQSVERTVVGGVLFVPPARCGGGWEYANDAVYWEAYEKFKLNEVDAEAYDKLVSYEKWETKNVSDKLYAAGIPLWNGLFCAIDPAYAGTGCGSMNYADCMKIMAQVHRKNQLENQSSPKPEHLTTDRSSRSEICKKSSTFGSHAERKEQIHKVSSKAQTNFKGFSQLFRREFEDAPNRTDGGQIARGNPGYGLKLIHALSLLHHRPRLLLNTCSKQLAKIDNPKADQIRSKEDIVNEDDSTRKPMRSTLPLVVAFSHSLRAVSFHKKNGFQMAGEVDFNSKMIDSNKESSPFSVHILMMDPFNTGKIDEIARQFREPTPAPTCRESPVDHRTSDKHCESGPPKIKTAQSLVTSSMYSISPVATR